MHIHYEGTRTTGEAAHAPTPAAKANSAPNSYVTVRPTRPKQVPNLTN